jgi:hypothetical protein
MNEHDDVMVEVRESLSGLRMDTPLEEVFARSRARRRRRLSGLTAGAATAGAAAAITLALGPGPAIGGPGATPSASPPPKTGPVALTAFSVASGPGDRTTLVLHKGPKYPRLDPAALRAALARHGIPALVTVDTFCRSIPSATSGLGDVVHPSSRADGSAMVIDGQAMPPGTRLSIGYFQGHVRMGLVKDGARLSCGSGSDQPAAHLPATGTPIRTTR